MKTMDKLAIFLAQNSLAKNNKNRITSTLCRHGCYTLARIYCAISPEYIRLQNSKGNPKNTYPWPYREKWFQIDDLHDPSGFRFGTGESYCAWKYSERFYCRLPEPQTMLEYCPRHWRSYLAHCGFFRVESRPLPGHHYIGIAPSMGENGEAVWFEGFSIGNELSREKDEGGKIVFSGYREGEYFLGVAPSDWYIWIEVSNRTTMPSYGVS